MLDRKQTGGSGRGEIAEEVNRLLGAVSQPASTINEIRARLDEFVAGGITPPIVTPITTPHKVGELIEALAP